MELRQAKEINADKVRQCDIKMFWKQEYDEL